MAFPKACVCNYQQIHVFTANASPCEVWLDSKIALLASERRDNRYLLLLRESTTEKCTYSVRAEPIQGRNVYRKRTVKALEVSSVPGRQNNSPGISNTHLALVFPVA
eukprot:TRINITY_DN341_c0_g1_i2.p1 TRINITY_DN341_c0_g1~~TRINITY_DN341_c0_g1_i2.p1  ORF type:complete len:107 (-),score=3.07 TRINITY_DN341_c0_g1_i2:370-690(-)